jgi:hypothetical protein
VYAEIHLLNSLFKAVDQARLMAILNSSSFVD